MNKHDLICHIFIQWLADKKLLYLWIEEVNINSTAEELIVYTFQDEPDWIIGSSFGWADTQDPQLWEDTSDEWADFYNRKLKGAL